MSGHPTNPEGVDRRRLLGAAGAGAAALAGLVAPVSAARAESTIGAGGGIAIRGTSAEPGVGSPAAHGYVYRTASHVDFLPSTAVPRLWGTYGLYSDSDVTAYASMDVPTASRVREIEWYCVNVWSDRTATMWISVPGGSSSLLAETVIGTVDSPELQVYRAVIPSSSYGPFPLGSKLTLAVGLGSGWNFQLNGARVGFSHGGGAVGLLSAPVRAYDSREHSKLSAGSTRTITLPSSVCPVGTTAVSANIIVVAAEGDGYLKAWPGHVASTEASAVSFLSGKSTANAQILGVSATRQVKVWSSKKAHVVIDVIGTVG